MFLPNYSLVIIVVFLIVISIPLLIIFKSQKFIQFKSANFFVKKIEILVKGFLGLLLKFSRFKRFSNEPLASLIDPRAKYLKDLPNGFKGKKQILPDSSVIIYYEPYYSEKINKFVKKRKEIIVETFKRKGLSFLYFENCDSVSAKETIDIVSYFFPQLVTKNKKDEIIIQIDELIKNNLAKELFQDFDIIKPSLIRLKNKGITPFEYSIFYLPEEEESIIEEAFTYYLSIIPRPIQQIGTIQFRKSKKVLGQIDSPIEISEEFKEELQKILSLNGKAQTLKSMLTLIEKVSPEKIGFEGKLLSTLNEIHEKIQPKISELVISSKGDIFLKDYNKAIKLTPLQKTVFLFFLSKPTGIYFKDLPNYKNELLEIYSRVSSRTDLITLKESIEELANPYSNSMSEKCSRIKEAFLKQIDDEWAQHYYISGDRNEKKFIKLDRSLVFFENTDY